MRLLAVLPQGKSHELSLVILTELIVYENINDI